MATYNVIVNETNQNVIVQVPGIQGPATPAGGAPDWGDIGGTLSDQTDLQSALDSKVDENAAAGASFSGEVIAMTASNAANGAWETLTYTTPTASDNTAIEFYVVAMGSAGWINIDSITVVQVAAQTNTEVKKFTEWVDGMPSTQLQKNSDSLGKITYWVDGMPYATVYPSDTNTSNFMLFMPF